MSEPYGYTIFCDDIREEVGSKTSFMGVYNGSMTVFSELPVHLPKLALAINLIIPGGVQVKELSFAIKRDVGGEEEELLRADNPTEFPAAAPGRVARVGMNLQISPFLVDRDFVLKARAYLNGTEIKIGALEISLKAPAEAAPTAQQNEIN